MATDNDDVLLDSDGDDSIKSGDFELGDGSEDDCVIILKLNRGALKSDPLMGPNLITMMNKKYGSSDIIQAIRIAFERDGKRPKNLSIVGGQINIAL